MVVISCLSLEGITGGRLAFVCLIKVFIRAAWASLENGVAY